MENSGEVIGVREDTERVQERLTSFLQNGCSAPIAARGGRHSHRSRMGSLARSAPPTEFEPLRYDGRAWIRRERSSVEPSPAELQELYNVFGYILTEERCIEAADVRHIDLEAFDTYLRRLGFDTTGDPQPDRDDDLRNRDVLREIGGELRATLYGALAFGRAPQGYLQTRNFRIECVRYAGDDRAAEVLQVAQGGGRLNEAVDRSVAWFMDLGWTESYRGIIRENRHLLPRPAIREALVNAVTHRDYAITGSKVPARSVSQPGRCHQSRHAAQPHDGSSGPCRRQPALSKRVHGVHS